jgi:hypothetical protein
VRPTIQVAFDAADPHRLAAFWAEALDYVVEDHTDVVRQLLAVGQLRDDEAVVDGDRLAFRDVATCVDRLGTGPRLFFQRVPEPKAAKNRVHLDLQVGADAAPAEVRRLVALGATVAWETADRGPVTTTLRDPEGNELCVS